MSFPPPGGQDPYQPQPPDESNPYAQPVPPSPAYQQPYPQYSQPVSQKTNGMAIASMLTGITSIVLCICCPLLPVLSGGVAVALGFVGLKQIKERGDGGQGMAIAGIATGGVAIVLGIARMIFIGFDIAGTFDSDSWDSTDWDD